VAVHFGDDELAGNAAAYLHTFGGAVVIVLSCLALRHVPILGIVLVALPLFLVVVAIVLYVRLFHLVWAIRATVSVKCRS
jgi:hypothetical protein